MTRGDWRHSVTFVDFVPIIVLFFVLKSRFQASFLQQFLYNSYHTERGELDLKRRKTIFWMVFRQESDHRAHPCFGALTQCLLKINLNKSMSLDIFHIGKWVSKIGGDTSLLVFRSKCATIFGTFFATYLPDQL